MTQNANQPNRTNPTDTSRSGSQAIGQQGQSERDERARSLSAAGSSQGQQSGDETMRFLDAIEENVNKLRSAMGGSQRREGSANRDARQGVATLEDGYEGDEGDRSELSRSL